MCICIFSLIYIYIYIYTYSNILLLSPKYLSLFLSRYFSPLSFSFFFFLFHVYGINVRLEKYLHLTLNLSCPTPTVPPHADFLHPKNKTRHPWCELVQHHYHPYLSLMMKLRRNQRVFLNFWKLINNNYHLKVVVQKYISLKLKISPQKSPSSWMWLVVHFKSKNKSLIKKNLNKSEKIIRLRNNTNDLCIIIKYLVWYFGCYLLAYLESKIKSLIFWD